MMSTAATMSITTARARTFFAGSAVDLMGVYNSGGERSCVCSVGFELFFTVTLGVIECVLQRCLAFFTP